MYLSLAKLGDTSPFVPRGLENRGAFFQRLGIDANRVKSLRQVHSKSVLCSDEPDFQGSTAPEGDGICAADPGEILSVSVADCMPIYLFHAGTRSFALLHSGWRGTGIVAEALTKMERRFGVAAEQFTVVLGPSIRSCCYRVDRSRADLFARRWGGDSVVIRRDEGGGNTHYLNLLEANRSLLERIGVRDIRYVDECSVCNTEMGSFRREGPEVFTHMLAIFGYFD